MKKLVILLISILSFPLIAVDVSLDSLTKLTTVPAAVRPSFLTLAGKGEGYYLPYESKEAKELASATGTGPALIELADRVYDDGAEDDYDHLLNVFNILQLVPVLSEADLVPVRKRLLEIWNKEDLPRVAAYKQGGLFLLGNHPSQSSEDVLIKYLDERVDTGMVGLCRIAIRSLIKSGSNRALKPLERYLERYGAESFAGRDAVEAIETIKKRIAEAKPAKK